MEKTKKKSIFDNPFLSTKVKSANTKLFPEGVLGYFIGPTFALLANSILSGYFNRYMTDVLNITAWAQTFFNLLPIISVIFVVLGNILVGRLMDHSKTKAGKARPLLLLSIPLSILALIVLFIISPFANQGSTDGTKMFALAMIAVGYVLWFAVAYPLYYTPHAGLVTLSTRSSKDRSLLATISNATTLAAMGLCTMILPFFLGLLFVNQTDINAVTTIFIDGKEVMATFTERLADGSLVDPAANVIIERAVAGDTNSAITAIINKASNSAILDANASYNAWKIFVIALMIITAVGVLIEYYFTRERVTEEQLANNTMETKKSTPISQQAKICLKDKFWWIMILFFFLYQLGGMMKNVSQLYYCSAMFADDKGVYSTAVGGNFSGTIAIIGAIPTAIGMVIAWPLSNKIGKGKAILFGAILSAVGGVIGFIAPTNFIVACVSFVVKALGSTPAMYLSLALLADVMDHQEAMHGVRTDGFTMTIYGAIMAGMTGIATGILNITISACGYSQEAVSNEALRTAMPWIFIGGETICYAIIAIIFIFMGVEKFSALDHTAITVDQKAKAEAEGVEFEEPAERLKREEAEADAAVEEARKQELKAKCEKKGLNFEEEEAKYQKALAEKQAQAEAKKKAAEEKKAKAEAEKQAKLDAMSEEKKKKLEEAARVKAEKRAKAEEAARVEFNALREKNGKPAI